MKSSFHSRYHSNNVQRMQTLFGHNGKDFRGSMRREEVEEGKWRLMSAKRPAIGSFLMHYCLDTLIRNFLLGLMYMEAYFINI